MNRKERRATIKKSKGDPELVIFAVHAPPLGTQMTVVKTNLQAFEAMNYGADPAKLREMTLTQQILTWDKDIIRAIYYPDEVQSVKATPQFFTVALARVGKSVVATTDGSTTALLRPARPAPLDHHRDRTRTCRVVLDAQCQQQDAVTDAHGVVVAPVQY